MQATVHFSLMAQKIDVQPSGLASAHHTLYQTSVKHCQSPTTKRGNETDIERSLICSFKPNSQLPIAEFLLAISVVPS
jgi:hypothetical protein